MKSIERGGRLRAAFSRRGTRFYVIVTALAAVVLAVAGVGSYALADGFAQKTGAWTNLHASGSVDAHIPNATAYDTRTGKAFLFYSPEPQSLVATWTYDTVSNSFSQVAKSGTEPQLAEFEVAYDETAGKVICFGYPMYAESVETWAFDPAMGSWTELHPGASPPVRQGASMAYDAGLGRVVLFGGNNRSDFGDWMWAYDEAANTWTELKTEGAPSPRVDAAMAYDDASGRLLLFGGYRNSPDPAAPSADRLGDTWAYEAKTNTWTELKPVVSPPGRLAAMMVYDKTSGKMILSGGYGFDNVFGDTWAYDSQANTWTKLNPAGSPGARAAAAVFYDRSSGKVVICGGAGSDRIFSDAWAFSY
jgi:N-acetylneuraminic acid mutarotase